MSTTTRLTTITGVVTAIGIAAITFVGQWEGLRLHSYKDVVGVWTACYGETKGIKPGMKFTKAECDEMFIESGLKRHERALLRCLNDPYTVPESTYVAMLSLAYNIGEGGFCRSSVVKRWNEGKQYASCDAFKYWNKAGGRVIRGLVNRRAAERKLCIKGLSEPVTVVNPEDVPVADRPVVRRGYRGYWVEYLQKLVGAPVDGQFGPTTCKYVAEFQAEYGLVEDCVVGPATWDKLKEIKE